MESEKYEVGHVYFRLHIWAEPDRSYVVSSWVYEGHVADESKELGAEPCSQGLRFVEWESWLRQRDSTEPCPVTGIAFPSLATAEMTMLSWQELLQRITDYSRFELHNKQFAVLADTEHLAAIARVRIATTFANPHERAFSICGELLYGNPKPEMRAVVVLGSLLCVSLRIQSVEYVSGTNKDLISLTFDGSSEEVQMCSHLAMEGRILDVVKLVPRPSIDGR